MTKKISPKLDAFLRRQNPRPSKVGSNSVASLGFCDLRAFWPSSSFDENQTLYDVTGQGRHLTADGKPVSFLHNDKIPFMQYNGARGHTRADEAGLDVTGSLTIGLWTIIDTLNNPALLVKDDGATQHSYGLDVDSGAFRFYVYAAALTAVSSTVTPVAGVPFFICGRFTSGSKVDIFVNGVWTTATTANTAVTNSTSALYYGERNGAKYLTGKLTWGFITAAAASDIQIRQMYDSAKSAFGVYQ